MTFDVAPNVEPRQIARSFVEHYGDLAVFQATMRRRGNAVKGRYSRANFWDDVLLAVSEMLHASPAAQAARM